MANSNVKEPATTVNVENPVIVRQDFWHTTIGVFAKRLFFSIVAQAGLVLYTGVVNHMVHWHDVLYAAMTQGLYIVITAVRDVRDPQMPNTPGQTVVMEKAK